MTYLRVFGIRQPRVLLEAPGPNSCHSTRNNGNRAATHSQDAGPKCHE
jgi:hypothetical protein